MLAFVPLSQVFIISNCFEKSKASKDPAAIRKMGTCDELPSGSAKVQTLEQLAFVHQRPFVVCERGWETFG